MSNEDTLKQLGKLVDDWAQRDAVHIAVVPLVAKHELRPGQRVGVSDGMACGQPPHLGVVDPYLSTPVSKGERFFVFLNPGSITSLRHNWTHPDFPDNSKEQEAAQAWMDAYAAGIGVSTGELMWNAINFLRTGEYWNEGDKFEGMHVPEGFWIIFEKLTGTKVENKKGSFFSCSC